MKVSHLGKEVSCTDIWFSLYSHKDNIDGKILARNLIPSLLCPYLQVFLFPAERLSFYVITVNIYSYHLGCKVQNHL